MESKRKRAPRGYASYVTVLTLGIIVLVMLLNSYRTSIRAHAAQKEVTLRIDYADKEDEILRAVVNLTPNRAIRAMTHESDATSASRNPLRWGNIFSDALDQVNARESVATAMLNNFGLQDARVANTGDTAFPNVNAVFDAIEPESGYVAPGIGRSLGAGFPAPLETANVDIINDDRVFPIISRQKIYGPLAAGEVGLPVDEYPEFNLISFPEIRFSYTEPGQPFVAKRNWWAFSLDLADADDHLTGLDRMERDFIISIYEIPSQLAISAEAFAILGQHEDGSMWENASVEGAVFATRAKVEEGMDLSRISGRRGLEFGDGVKIDSKAVASDPFAPGVREKFEIDYGEFLPVSLASEAGRAAFLPINRGPDFFDRYSHSPETNTVSPTTWNDYSVGAMQCAMRLDVTEVAGEFDKTPTELRFQYFKGGTRQSVDISLIPDPATGLPPGYIYCCDEDEMVNFPYPVDVAYGKNGSYYYEEAVVGDITFNNARFGDPLVGTFKAGYFKPSFPWNVSLLHEEKWCIEIYPERFKKFLELLGGDSLAVNHSVAVNVDHRSNADIAKPSIPCAEHDYGVILKECADLTSFTEGFSLVTNLRLYIADDFNTATIPPPAGSGIPDPFYPPSSLFAPEKRYGAETNPLRLKIGGQVGSLAGDTGESGQKVHLLDLRDATEADMAHDRIEVNLTQIRHPEALPPITMMNWLIMVEERRAEFYVAQSP
ncbi:hypothetical protein HAHE_30070 [Haloferula helveola]|uniref:Uncharacterized protein n=2 Tax=Haloferula helveola TaxID=490095 RepID=A0ABM7RGZ2_9BACT|nr:hypothetical protein HAHE_30070 [Haloferula helveola]